MAFASAITETTVMGNKKVVLGTYSNTTGVTEGVIATGLTHVQGFTMTAEVTDVSVTDGSATVTMEDPAGTVAGFWSATGL